jgi:formylmethanofuran dehydrogenase subunit C
LSRDAVQRIRLAHGSRRVALGDIFEVHATTEHAVSFTRASRRLRRIGRGMSNGLIRVSGDAGDEVGAGMRGGEIRLNGNAHDFVGSGMRGGAIYVNGNCGDFSGGSLPHEALGMREGLICVRGNTGARTGDRMRRGLLIVNGDVGPYCAANMIAGTIVVTGRSGTGLGIGMRRGTVLCAQPPVSVPATFADCGHYSLAILALLVRHIRTLDKAAYRHLKAIGRVQRLAGDLAAGGQGELLIAASGNGARDV